MIEKLLMNILVQYKFRSNICKADKEYASAVSYVLQNMCVIIVSNLSFYQTTDIIIHTNVDVSAAKKWTKTPVM